MNARSTTRGRLACREMDWLPAGRPPAAVAVLCHGYGAPGTDLVALGAELVGGATALAETVRFIFPAAPLSLDAVGLPGGRAWWPFDLNRLVAALERGETRVLCGTLPPGLETARAAVVELIEDVRQETGLPLSKFVLGGFSQGAILATDVALRLPEPPGGLCLFSGTLVCEPEWGSLAAARGPLPVFQSHGRHDPLLPFEAAVWLRDLLAESGLPVDFLPFAGGHEIPLEALERAAGLIGQVAGH